jgi:hypothetical protein
LFLPLRRIVAELVRPALASAAMLFALMAFVDFVASVDNEPTHSHRSVSCGRAETGFEDAVRLSFTSALMRFPVATSQGAR